VVVVKPGYPRLSSSFRVTTPTFVTSARSGFGVPTWVDAHPTNIRDQDNPAEKPSMDVAMGGLGHHHCLVLASWLLLTCT
jgi:hypothetical protein